jgi:hypothetical protein
MSISHWGIFPGYWISVTNDPDLPAWALYPGSDAAKWMPCSYEELVQWQ